MSTQQNLMPGPAHDSAKIALVAEWILAGCRVSQIPAEAAKAKWEVSWEQLTAIIDAAFHLIIADAQTRAGVELAKSIDRLNALYAKCLAIQDYKAALACQKELNKVLSLYQTQVDATKPSQADAEEGEEPEEGEGFAGILADVA